MALIIDIKVVPSSGRQEFKLDKAGMLVCYLKSPPERGLANKELVKSLAKGLKIPQMDVLIISGATSRKKRLSIKTAMDRAQLLATLGLHASDDTQLKMF